MPKTRLALVPALALVALVTSGCMKAPAAAGATVLVVPVARLDDSAASRAAVVPGAAVEPRRVTRAEGDHAPGDRVEVEQHDAWLPATLIERRGDRWLVHYDERRGFPGDDTDELVEADRIRVPLGLPEDDPGTDDADP